MSAPRLDVRLDHIHHNASVLVRRLGARGIAVTGVTKATLGSALVAAEVLRAGVVAIGESRIEGIEGLRRAGQGAPMTLIRSPMPSQADRVVRHADLSLNSEIRVVEALSASASSMGRTHGVVLMVELGDRREGMLPCELEDAARRTVALPGIELHGIGTNLACQSGVVPDAANMAELSALAVAVEAAVGQPLAMVSGGNSANLGWALGGGPVGRVDDLRLGEAILLGLDPLHRRPIDGLRTDAFTLRAEVIEARAKASSPSGAIAQTAFGTREPTSGRGTRQRVIVALGEQDVDPMDLAAPRGLTIVGASSDHLILEASDSALEPGDTLSFGVGYSALLRAMTSPFVAVSYC